MWRFPQWRFLAGVILLKISLYYDAPSATAEPSELFPYFQHFFPVFKKVWFFWKNMLTIMVSPDILTNVPSERNKFKANWLGGLAQLGERLTGSQEVSGSIPLFSTKKTCNHNGYRFSFYYTKVIWNWKRVLYYPSIAHYFVILTALW